MQKRIIILDDVRRDAESLKSNLCYAHGYPTEEVMYYLRAVDLYKYLAEIVPANLAHHVIILDLWWGETKNSSQGEEILTYLKKHHQNLNILVVSNFLDMITYQKVQMLGANGAIEKQDFENVAKAAIETLFEGGTYFVKTEWNNLETANESKVTDLVLYLALGFKNKYAAKIAGLSEDSANTYKSKLAKAFGEVLSDENNHIQSIIPKENEWNEISFLLIELRNGNPLIIRMIEELTGVKILLNHSPINDLNYSEIVRTYPNNK